MNKRPTLKCLCFTLIALLCSGLVTQAQAQKIDSTIIDAKKLNATSIDLSLKNKKHILIDFYADNIFRLFEDDNGKTLRDPEADPSALILVGNAKKPVDTLALTSDADSVYIATAKIRICFSRANGLFNVKNLQNNKLVIKQTDSVKFTPNKTVLNLKASPDEYFYGGGLQNGRFSHKGKNIAIENQNSWTDGGVASPVPYYWSTGGYGMMWYTFKKGNYDFGAQDPNNVQLSHSTDYLDVFFMINEGAVPLLNDYYQLTGHPVLLPKFGFYEGHLNAYNRDYWKKDSTGILFEDGYRYKESQKDNGGIKESLNGEKDNYQFSARAVIDRYKDDDMPLGWILPNDGYGAGYGQDSALEGNIRNLKEFGDYARKNNVELGLWTQSDLHPKPGVEALLQRDIVNEVQKAGVRVLKTDVAWVGAGYSFGLNGIADVADITTTYGNNARPFIISLDGWAGTQRYAAIWSGDQTGGNWEYIRFHIPTYIGSGLSGIPNVTSDMDGIFGGDNPIVNTRDFQWKTFSPMQLNMDGWGANPKYPQALGEPATSINRNYLKLKSELLPYTYSIAQESIDGLPMIRAMFLEEHNEYTLGTATKYQFMYGPYFIVAPIYQNTAADKEGNDVRHFIYLPEGDWYDYFTGEYYKGGRIINYFEAPLWKLSTFVKGGAIIPENNPNNNIKEVDNTTRIIEVYPKGKSVFTLYDDDGRTNAYRNGAYTQTELTSVLEKGKEIFTIHPTTGGFDGFTKDKSTLLKFNVSERPKRVQLRIDNKKKRLREVKNKAEFNQKNNVYYYEEAPEFNRFATKDSEFSKKEIRRNPQVRVKIALHDVTEHQIEVTLEGYVFDISNNYKKSTGKLHRPQKVTMLTDSTTAFSLTPTWEESPHADYYEIEFEEMLYTHITSNQFTFSDLKPETSYNFRLRAVNKEGYSDWVDFRGKTDDDPLEFAIPNVTGYATAPAQGGFALEKLFDFDESNNIWHTKYQKKAVPFDLIIDMHSRNKLDKLVYFPRSNGKNGIITKAKIYYSRDKKDWKGGGELTWEDNNSTKEYQFEDQPTARFIKIEVTEAVGDYGSGRELYIMKVPGSESYIPGDINKDGRVDENDLTSYMNYMGLKKGDADFEGYIDQGDVNNNDHIDAFDVSNVATQLDEGAQLDSLSNLKGEIRLTANKSVYKKGEAVEITVTGKSLNDVNALGFGLPYNPKNIEYKGIQTLHTKQMEDLTKDRLHSDGEKVLYPTFVNIGDQEVLEGDDDLFIIKFEAKRDFEYKLQPEDGIIVSKDLETLSF